jgi:hypothetical protein
MPPRHRTTEDVLAHGSAGRTFPVQDPNPMLYPSPCGGSTWDQNTVQYLDGNNYIRYMPNLFTAISDSRRFTSLYLATACQDDFIPIFKEFAG